MMNSTIQPLRKLNIDECLRQKVVDFAYNQTNFFVSNTAGAGRRLCNLNRNNVPLTEDVKAFAKQSYQFLGIQDFEEEPLFGNFIGFNQENAFVHRHRDPGKGTKWHVRLNFLIQKPISGGMPIINGVVYDVDEGSCWLNIASSWWHGSAPVVGNKERIVLSLGALIEESSAVNLL